MLHLEIVTPEKIVFSDDVDMVVVPGIDGQLGILPKHTSLVAQLTEGELILKKEGHEQYLSIGGGFVEVNKGHVIVLVTRALHADELNESQIITAKRDAEEALKKGSTSDQAVSIKQALRQSLFDLKILNKRKRNV